MTFSPMRNEGTDTQVNAPPKRKHRSPGWFLLAGLLLVSGCASVEKAVSTRFGLHRQDTLVRELHAAREAHLVAQDQFAVATEAFDWMLEPEEEIPLRQRYEDLSREFVRTEFRAAEMRDATDRLERAARAYFMDWEDRLYEYADPVIRNTSRRQLDTTRQEYEEAVGHVRRTEVRTNRVLDALGDQVRYLRHNLNHQALAALRNPAIELQLEMKDLLEELERAADHLDRVAESFRVE